MNKLLYAKLLTLEFVYRFTTFITPFPQWSNLDMHKLEEDIRKQVISKYYKKVYFIVYCYKI